MTEQQTKYRFEGFELDSQRRLLLGPDGEPVTLTARSLDLLVHLVLHRGQVIGKQALLEAIWPDVVVEEHSLTQAVSSLRQALGERPGDHRFLATVPGRGYCFVAEVVAVPRAGPPEDATDDRDVARDATHGAIANAPAPGTTHGARAFGLTGAVAAAVLAIVAVLIGRYAVVDSGAMRIGTTEIVSTFPGNHTQPDLSPDGSSVAFVSDTSGEPQIWVGNVRHGEPQQITFVPGGARHPVWSPSGNEILFHAVEGGIWSIGPLGTPGPRLVIEDGRNPSLSADGSTIVFERDAAIWLANSDGTGQRELPGVPESVWPYLPAYPRLSPDGSYIAFLVYESGPLSDLWVSPTAGGTAIQLTFDSARMGRPVWTPDGRYLVFPSNRAGTQTLWHVPASGGTPEPVTPGVGVDRDPAISTDGALIVYTNTRIETRFVARDPETGEDEVLYRSRNLSVFPRVAPDARHIAFFSEQDTGEEIFVMNADGTGRRQLTFGNGLESNIMPRWHPDSETLFYYATLSSRALRKLSIRGGQSEIVFNDFEWENHLDAELSPRGDAVAFTQVDPSGENPTRIVVRHIESGDETLIDAAMRQIPNWSADGQYLLGSGDNEIVLCPVTGEECKSILEVQTRPGLPLLMTRWSPDQSRIFYAIVGEDPAMRELWVVDRDGRNSRRLFEYGPAWDIAATFEVMPDGRILWTEDVAETELWRSTIE